MHGRINSDEMGFVQQAVAAGAGIGLLPQIGVRLATKGSPEAENIRLLPEFAVTGGDLNVVTPSTRFQSAAVTAFRDFLVAELAQLWNSL